MDDLKVGNVCPMKSMTIVRGNKTDGELSLTYRKPKGKNYVFLLLGVENDNGTDPLDCEKRMNELGWFLK